MPRSAVATSAFGLKRRSPHRRYAPRRSHVDTAMLQSIYAHASWANEKLFDAAAQIS
jgi:hypothetical protein